MIEIVCRRRGRMIGMRVVVADHAQPAASRIVVRALVLLGRDQVSSLARLRALVLSSVNLAENIGIAFALSKEKPAAFVRISCLAVLFYLVEVI